MIVLVDTSVWIDYFRRGNERLSILLKNKQVLAHELIIGELACGPLPDRASTLSNLLALPRALNVPFSETLHAIDRLKLISKGIGFIDVCLLSAALTSQSQLWSRDKKLMDAADALGVSFQELN